ncbi:uncharacterized protein LOC120261976 isoform X2 [Dioscorea cayenensis subsp. rotundata]|uniref:Uncharacterized protein LOC120261976 isoform X2 n=1 Tax=Dioscorea cayennensis subsp. rotundata TaxID=55577 RepID=A0AB40BF43_DIOCR|nr:uncharacterized protein LOC120261976 isoform X2 [Dioscorea cayenensis subsp. rotundata]
MAGRVSKKKKGVADAADALSWRQKKALADVEEAAVTGEVEELISWTTMAENKDDGELKRHLLSRAEVLHGTGSGEGASGKKGQKNLKTRLTSASTSSSQGVMASIWKFHMEDDEEPSLALPT